MEKLGSVETVLTGIWQVGESGSVEADENCRRIDSLIENYLERIGASADGWDVFYLDPDDGRIWRLTYPHSHMHGGGPSQLECVSLDESALMQLNRNKKQT
jgi:hypothetical protein